MKTFVITAEINKPYSEWKAGFDGHRAVREQHGISEVYAGRIVDEQRVVVVLQAESQAALDDMMRAEADKISATGHVVESTQIIVAES